METYSTDLIGKVLSQLQLERVLFLFLGIASLVYVVKFLYRLSARLTRKFPARRLLILQIQTTLSFFVYVLGGTFLSFAVLSPTKELLLALGGGMAVAVGFSLKDLVASLFAGLILLFDRPFQVGDRVQFGDTYGEITSIGLRVVRLQTLDDSTVTIPNSRFITDVVSSGNTGAIFMMITIPFHFALDADFEQARDILYETVVTSRFVYLERPVTIVASEVALGNVPALRLTAKAYVLDVRYEKDFQTDVVMRASALFREKAIKRPLIPFGGTMVEG